MGRYGVSGGLEKSQVAKDAHLLKTKQLDEITWVFYRSPQTGKVGASQTLLNELKNAGIKTEIRELPLEAIAKALQPK